MCLLSHLTYGASVRPENAVTYSAGNEGQKICGVFSETAPLQRSSTPSVVRLIRSRPFLSLRKMRMRMSSPRCISACIYTAAITPRVCTLVLFILILYKLFYMNMDLPTVLCDMKIHIVYHQNSIMTLILLCCGFHSTKYDMCQCSLF